MVQNYFQENLAALIRMNQTFVAGFVMECLRHDIHPKQVDAVITERVVERVRYLSETLREGVPASMDATACEIVAALMDLTRDHIALADLVPQFSVELRDAIRFAGMKYEEELVDFVNRCDE
jgi:hypothetical protein